MSQEFKFKQFTVQQDLCAMKVGTDGVLLGAWVDIKDEYFSILDIGTGTGVIALQAAQRSFAEQIEAVEIEPEAYVQAVQNFENSPWSDRLFCFHASFEEFVEEMYDEEYDLIISNPPFFTSTYKEDTIEDKRATARHVDSLPYDLLLKGTSMLLSEIGSAAFVIPYEEENNFVSLAEQYGLYLNRVTHVKGTENSSIKRSLLQFSFQTTEVDKMVLIIEIDRHQYTDDYTSLVKDFYLKM